MLCKAIDPLTFSMPKCLGHKFTKDLCYMDKQHIMLLSDKIHTTVLHVKFIVTFTQLNIGGLIRISKYGTAQMQCRTNSQFLEATALPNQDLSSEWQLLELMHYKP